MLVTAAPASGQLPQASEVSVSVPTQVSPDPLGAAGVSATHPVFVTAAPASGQLPQALEVSVSVPTQVLPLCAASGVSATNPVFVTAAPASGQLPQASEVSVSVPTQVLPLCAASGVSATNPVFVTAAPASGQLPQASEVSVSRPLTTPQLSAASALCEQPSKAASVPAKPPGVNSVLATPRAQIKAAAVSPLSHVSAASPLPITGHQVLQAGQATFPPQVSAFVPPQPPPELFRGISADRQPDFMDLDTQATMIDGEPLLFTSGFPNSLLQFNPISSEF